MTPSENGLDAVMELGKRRVDEVEKCIGSM